MGLESLNENLSEMKCELTLSGGKLAFRPPLEELRASYYREMKKFISIPNSFTGLGDNKKVRGGPHGVSSLLFVPSACFVL